MNRPKVQRKNHILVIDDTPSDVELLRMALSQSGVDCSLTILDDGAEGLSFARQESKYAGQPPLDLAIIDLNLPKRGGLEVLEALRASPVFAGLPVIILTSSPSPHERARTETIGVSRYLMKPFDLDEYLKIGQIVEELLSEPRSYEAASGA